MCKKKKGTRISKNNFEKEQSQRIPITQFQDNIVSYTSQDSVVLRKGETQMSGTRQTIKKQNRANIVNCFQTRCKGNSTEKGLSLINGGGKIESPYAKQQSQNLKTYFMRQNKDIFRSVNTADPHKEKKMISKGR